jgi:hypothetical protein
MNLIVEFNVLSRSGFGIEIGQLCAEIPLLSHRKACKIATFRKNRWTSNLYNKNSVYSKKENFQSSSFIIFAQFSQIPSQMKINFYDGKSDLKFIHD